MKSPADESHGRPSLVRRVRQRIWNALALAGLFFIVYHTCFELAPVVSGSMKPTLCGEGGPTSPGGS